MDTHDDVMAQLATQYYTMSRNRSASAPIRPNSSNLTWQYSENSNINITSQLPLPPPPDVDLVTSLMADSELDPRTQNIHHFGENAHHFGDNTHQFGDSNGATVPYPHDRNVPYPQNAPYPEDVHHFSGAQTLSTEPDGIIESSDTLLQQQLPATFLRTLCDQIEYYFCDANLLGDLYLLKNMNTDGYVKLELIHSFNRVKRLSSDISELRKALELSTKLLMNEDETLVCRKIPLAPQHTYHGKLARTAIAYNLPVNASVALLKEMFQECGSISYLRLLKQNVCTGRNAVLKPPITAGETYAIVEFEDESMAKRAVLTLSDQYNWRTGMQVVLFDGTNCDKLRQRMFAEEGGGDRRRARSTSAVTRAVHVDAVGEGLDSLQEGRVSTGTVFSIRGAGGLIHPTRLDNAAISFRLIADEDGNMDIRPGDYVSFTVGKNKKSGRKYASKVRLEFRSPSQSMPQTGTSPSGTTDSCHSSTNSSPSRWDMRNRSSTIGTSLSQSPTSPNLFRSRSSSNGARPRFALVSGTSHGDGGLGSLGYRQALGPDGTRGFGSRRNTTETGTQNGTSLSGTCNPEVNVTGKFGTMERRRSQSSAPAPQF